MPKTYHLYLSTQVTTPANNLIVPVNVTNKANATWQIDFKSLFGNDYDKYKRVTLRAKLISETYTPTQTDHNVYSGYLAVNLPSNNISSTTLGTPVMLISPSFSTYLNAVLSCYNNSTLENAQGVDIQMPNANQFMNIMFVNNDSMTLMTTVPEYQIMFQFELSEPIES